MPIFIIIIRDKTGAVVELIVVWHVKIIVFLFNIKAWMWVELENFTVH